MSNNVPIPKGLLRLQDHLSHDIYDKNGTLLLRRGTILDSDEVIERLEAMGYFDPIALEAVKAARLGSERVVPTGYVPDRSGTLFSAFAELESVCRRLQSAFDNPLVNLDSEIHEISALVQQCCAIDTDASLAALLVPSPFAHKVRHPVHVAILTALILARRKHDPMRIQAAVAAALTMNIGALKLHEELFFTSEALSDEQRAQIRAHPGKGVEALLARNVRNPLWLAIVAQHHEAFDGSGYPGGLAGDKILPEAQVVALADRYSSMVTERASRDAMLPPQALKDIHVRHGKALSPELIGLLVASMGIYPPGTCVRLVNGESAIVVHRILDPKHPVVYALHGPTGPPYAPPRKRLTASQPGYAIATAILRKDIRVVLRPEELWPATIAASGTTPTGP
jgi:hypothetical protein